MSQQVYDIRAMVLSNVMWQIVSGYTKPPHTEMARPFATGPTKRTVVTPFGSVLNESVSAIARPLAESKSLPSCD